MLFILIGDRYEKARILLSSIRPFSSSVCENVEQVSVLRAVLRQYVVRTDSKFALQCFPYIRIEFMGAERKDRLGIRLSRFVSAPVHLSVNAGHRIIIFAIGKWGCLRGAMHNNDRGIVHWTNDPSNSGYGRSWTTVNGVYMLQF